jgi:predicted nucleic acid-binding protein
MDIRLNYPQVTSRSLLLDTGPIKSLCDPQESLYIDAKLILEKIILNRLSLVITNATIYEAYTRILYDLYWRKAIEFLDNLAVSGIQIENVTSQDEIEAVKILKKYKNRKISYIDALNFAVMKRLRLFYAFTWDVGDYCSVGFIMR